MEVQLEKYCADYDKRKGINHNDVQKRTHFTIEKILETLKNMEVTNMHGI